MTGALASPLQPTLHGQIREELRGRLLAGDWLPNERMPSESELMAHYRVSRITVRQALGGLESERIIFKVPGKGSFVSDAKPFQELGRLQGFGEAMQGNGHETWNQLLTLETVTADPSVAERLRLSADEPVTHVERVRFLDRHPVSLDLTWIPARLGERLRGVDLARRDIFLILEHDLGTALGHADLALEAVAADARVATLLDVPEGTPVLHIERLTHDRAGLPIDYEHIYCRSDNFQYRLRLERR